MRAAALALLFGLSLCDGDETASGHGAAGATWVLAELDGAAFPARATLAFPEPGSIAGEAPCNRYFARQSVPYPWFRAEAIVATRRACADLAAETRYLRALEAMTLVEVAGDVLILRDEAGREMVFRAAGTE